MLIKTLSRKHNGGQLVAYVCRYILNPGKSKEPIKSPHHQKETVQFIIRHNLRARSSVKNFIKEYEENEQFRLVRRHDSVKLFHTVIAFGKGDRNKVTPAILKDVAYKFIQLRGINNLYLGTAHYNTDSTHLHLVVSGTQLNGRSSRISKQEHQRIKVTLENYQREKYPELVHSRVNHKAFTKQPTKEQIVAMAQQSRQTSKGAVCAVLQQALEKSANLKEFLDHVAASRYQLYHRGQKLQGAIDENGMKFRFSKLGFQPSIDELQQRSIDEEISLEDLRALRRGKQPIQHVPRPLLGAQPVQRIPLDEKEKKQIDELAALRSTQTMRDKSMGPFEQLPTLFDELEMRSPDQDGQNHIPEA